MSLSVRMGKSMGIFGYPIYEFKLKKRLILQEAYTKFDSSYNGNNQKNDAEFNFSSKVNKPFITGISGYFTNFMMQ